MAVGERVLPSRCFGWRSCSKARPEGARKRARRAGETAARRRRKQRRAAAHGDDDACDDDDDEGGCKGCGSKFKFAWRLVGGSPRAGAGFATKSKQMTFETD